MNDLQKEYEKETGLSPYYIGCEKDDRNLTLKYIKWLEKKIIKEHEKLVCEHKKLVELIEYCQFKCEAI